MNNSHLALEHYFHIVNEDFLDVKVYLQIVDFSIANVIIFFICTFFWRKIVHVFIKITVLQGSLITRLQDGFIVCKSSF